MQYVTEGQRSLTGALSMHKLISAMLLNIVFLSGHGLTDKPQKQPAILVEAQIVPRCYGLDCPPLPVPFDAYLCFQIKGIYYIGTYSPWGLPWAPPGKQLLASQGQSVEIDVKDERIEVVAPFKASLKRLHHYGLFRLASCIKIKNLLPNRWTGEHQ